jgi:glucose/arabinose dehydrogenase
MRRLAAIGAVLAAAACGSKHQGAPIDAAVIDGATGTDAAVPADARILPDGAVATCGPTSGTQLSVEPIASGLASPIFVTAPAGDTRLFVIEQPGRIRIIKDGAVLPTPFLDISADGGGPVLSTGNEQGLLGLAFHPDYAHNGRFYVNYTRSQSGSPPYANVFAEFTVSSDPDVADAATERDLLIVPKKYVNHNSGTVGFGPDGYLYLSLGDGGSGGDPDGNGQNTSALLAKVLRIDVDTRTGGKAYGIPPSNPFASSPDGPTDPRPEIFAYGFRNPYRWDFDRATGDLIIGDVGQGAVEEVDIIPAGQGAGADFGWNTYEGDTCYSPPCPGTTGFYQPAVTHDHANDGFCAIIGGAIYRGSCFPDLVGTYFYTDYCTHQLRAFTVSGATAVGDRALTVAGFPQAPTSIHADALGELYVTSRNGTVGHLFVSGP